MHTYRNGVFSDADLSAQALLQFTQLILFLEQRQGLVKTLWDLQEYSVKHGTNTTSLKRADSYGHSLLFFMPAFNKTKNSNCTNSEVKVS